MKMAIMQPYFLPYLGYFQLMEAVDKFVIYDDVNFIKRGWVNKNRILVNSEAHSFSIPLVKISQNKKINEVELLDDLKWKKKVMLTFQHAYHKAPYYETVQPILKKIIFLDTIQLSEYLLSSLELVKEYIGIKTSIVRSSTIYKNCNLSGSDRILDICQKEKASHYINAIGGKSLYQISDFELQNLKLNFLQSSEITYNQFGKLFVPNLSILDLMMFKSKGEIKNMVNQYELVS